MKGPNSCMMRKSPASGTHWHAFAVRDDFRVSGAACVGCASLLLGPAATLIDFLCARLRYDGEPRRMLGSRWIACGSMLAERLCTCAEAAVVEVPGWSSFRWCSDELGTEELNGRICSS